MKRLWFPTHLLALLMYFAITSSYAQREMPSRLFQAYYDDDYINFYGKGTDKAYTNGTRYTLFYTKKNPSQFLIDRLLPKAGDSSTNVFGIGLVQVIFTPDDITNPNFQPNDYPWSGALYLTHSLNSYNVQQKYDFQTELNLGFTGPASMARQVQEGFHKLIDYEEPKGWANQFGNSLILNLNFTAEKQVLQYGNFLEVIAGGQVIAGTMMNAATAYSTIRIGKMNPYFQGLMKQYSHSGAGNKVQFYLVIKPKIQWVLSNAILQGGIGASRPVHTTEYYHPINHTLASFAYGAVVVINRFSISSIQTTTTPWMKNLYKHTWGNFSFTYIW